MTHQRQVIRAAFVAGLKAASTAAGQEIHDNPSDVRTKLPAVTVTDIGENQATPTMPGGASRPVDRYLMLDASCEVKRTGDYAGARDSLAADVEAAAGTLAIAGVKWIVPKGCAFEESTRGDQPIAIARQRFELWYRTTQGNPAVAI